MRLFLPLLFLIFQQCQPQTAKQTNQEQTGAGLVFENGLAYDGCAEHIQLLSDSLLYRPTPASLPVLQRALTSGEPNKRSYPVTIRYKRTGQKTVLECGWGSRKEIDELEVLEITNR